MKKIKKETIFLIILIGLAVFFFIFQNRKSTYEASKGDFAITDTSEIYKISFKTSNRTLTLSRLNKSWQINQQAGVRPEAVKKLLTIIKEIRIKSPVPKTMTDSVVRELKNNGKKIVIFNKNNKIKSYLVGSLAFNQKGTYMMLENSKTPLIMHIPGYNADLNAYFTMNTKAWRDNSVFKIMPNQIVEINVKINENPQKSFQIKKQNNQYELIDYQGNKVKHNQKSIEQYFFYFTERKFEQFVNLTSQQKDSLNNTIPYYTIKIKPTNQQSQTVYFYKKYNRQTQSIDLNLLYAKTKKSQDIYLLKYFEFDPLFKKIDYFLSE